jgi:hypothetical protein
MDPAIFEKEIRPKLETVSLLETMRATGLSRTYCGKLPAGLAADVADGLLGRVLLGHGSYLLSEPRTLSESIPRFGPNPADGEQTAAEYNIDKSV